MKSKVFPFDTEVISDHISNLKAEKGKFQVLRSNYTTEIVEPNFKTIYTISDNDFDFFQLAAKLKKYYIDNPELIAKAEGISQRKPEYYQSCRNVPTRAIDCVCYDITSAYLNALKNWNLISEELYYMVANQPKKVRLKLLGMLARTKTILYYENGQIVESDISESPTKPIFLFAVKMIDQLLEELAHIAGPGFLFYWVDGIYINAKQIGHKKLQLIDDHINESGYHYNVEFLSDLRVDRVKDKPWIVQFSYLKNAKSEDRKTFTFHDKHVITEMNQYLNELIRKKEI
jgi:hypothetical protein